MRFVIVTGMSGAGRNSVMKMLEDMGYFCVDNLPVPLIPRMSKMMLEENSLEKVAVGIDIRNQQGLLELDDILDEMLADIRKRDEIILLPCREE